LNCSQENSVRVEYEATAAKRTQDEEYCRLIDRFHLFPTIMIGIGHEVIFRNHGILENPSPRLDRGFGKFYVTSSSGASVKKAALRQGLVRFEILGAMARPNKMYLFMVQLRYLESSLHVMHTAACRLMRN
jgi:hypothetical protein